MRSKSIILGLILSGLVVAGALAQSGQQRFPVPQVPPADVDPKMPLFVGCAKACDDCERMCEMCSAHCMRLVADGKKDHVNTVRLCQDCAAMCAAASRITAKDGPMTDLICASCVDACKRCGDACEKHSGNPMMKQCADECRKCEKACREMLKQAKAGG